MYADIESIILLFLFKIQWCRLIIHLINRWNLVNYHVVVLTWGMVIKLLRIVRRCVRKIILWIRIILRVELVILLIKSVVSWNLLIMLFNRHFLCILTMMMLRKVWIIGNVWSLVKRILTIIYQIWRISAALHPSCIL